MISYIIFRTQFKIWKNRFLQQLSKNPIVVFSVVLVVFAVIFLSWNMYTNFDSQLNDIAKNMGDGASVNKLIYNYINIIFLFFLAVMLLYNIKIAKDDFPEVLCISAYEESKIRKAFMLPTLTLICFSGFIFLLPYSMLMFKLAKLDTPSVLYLIFLQNLYIVYFAYISRILLMIVKFISFKLLRIRQEETLSSVIALFTIFIVWFLIWVSGIKDVYNFLPTGHVYNTIFLLKKGISLQVLVNIVLNLLNFAILVYFHDKVSIIFDVKMNDALSNKVFDIVSFRNRYVNTYLALVMKKVFRSINGIISLVSISFLLVFGAFLIGRIKFFEGYIFTYYQFCIYAMIFLIGIYVISFDDFDDMKSIKTFNGNLKAYNFIFILAITIFLSVVYLINYLLICTALKIKLSTIFEGNIYFVLMYVVIALLFKLILLNKGSSLFMNIFTSYGFIVVVFLVGELGFKISSRILTYLTISPLFSNLVTMLGITLIVYLVQLFFLHMRYENAN